ncbi:MAG: alginate lyase family protein [Anaerolineaceae bacterium]|nr:alginate lyase family protein [Anaerolineaceae bacterium]
MDSTNKVIRLLKTISDLGLIKSASFATYQLAKKSGFYRFFPPISEINTTAFTAPHWLTTFFPIREQIINQLHPDQIKSVLKTADQIVSGEMLAFGLTPISIIFDDQTKAAHWSLLSDNYADGDDIKLHWETARFSWVFPLIQAHILTNDAKYFQTFHVNFLKFVELNPYNMGLQWASGQEVAFRLIALISAFAGFSVPITADGSFKHELLQQIWLHSQRIPPTLIYARAQNNNHLLSEALALFYAGAFFESLPDGNKLRDKGWRIFNQTIHQQIQTNGTYVQQSINYHRLMLTEATWFKKMANMLSSPLPLETKTKLLAATNWLGQFVQPTTGQTPNLGHNDGSLIFPLSCTAYKDYRSILNASQLSFGDAPITTQMDYAVWLNIANRKDHSSVANSTLPHITGKAIQIYMRAETFPDRPAHADQNHTDIWFAGENIAQDAGTYRYTDLPPWNNGLAHTINHNTITINDADQMTWAGRFRWLDWSKGKYILDECNAQQITAIHNGYQKLGVLHKRTVKSNGERHIQVTDNLIPQTTNAMIQICRIHWLLPDGDWKTKENHLELNTKKTHIRLSLKITVGEEILPFPFAILRCGQVLHGSLHTAFPTLGWYSPSYNVKVPALSFLATIEKPILPLTLISQWQFSVKQDSDR